MPALLRAMRPQQWVKNLFVLAPVVFAHRLGDARAVSHALLALGAFCAGSSAIYLLNDVRDREADQNHPLKRRRPIAAGEVTPAVALLASGALVVAALGAGAALGRLTLALLLAFVFLNALYTWHLKHHVILDVMVLASGYLLRVEAGAAAASTSGRVEVSSWLLLCTFFVALFLGFSKRRHELMLLADRAADQRRVLSHYGAAFLDQMINVVTASTVLCYALYTMAEESVAKHGRGLVYTVPFVVYGVFRYLYLTYQRPGHANPTEEVLTDPPFLVNFVLWAAVVLAVLYVG
jgi:4-hydroxybenzoate polyprenyltransferase